MSVLFTLFKFFIVYYNYLAFKEPMTSFGVMERAIARLIRNRLLYVLAKSQG